MTPVPILRPSYLDFCDFNKFVCDLETKGLHSNGLVKVIPPSEWQHRPITALNEDVQIEPLHQIITGGQGFYQLAQAPSESLSIQQFKNLCYSEPTPNGDLESIYWETIDKSIPLYGSDVEGTLFEDNLNEWNLSKLGSILDLVTQDYGVELGGVTTSYLYYGMFKSSFPWHTEDMDLYSMNYIHYGQPKTWYSIPPKYGPQFEQLVNHHFVKSFQNCPAHLRHKTILVSPKVLIDNGIPFNKTVQEKNEFMITFPYGLHAGYNNGFNLAEAINFGTPRWIEYGKRARPCDCGFSTVKISMDTFVKRFQPERYTAWLNGDDFGRHPEEADDVIPYPAARPSIQDFLINKNNTVTRDIVDSLLDHPENPRRYKSDQSPEFEQLYPDIDVRKIKSREDIPKHIKDMF